MCYPGAFGMWKIDHITINKLLFKKYTKARVYFKIADINDEELRRESHKYQFPQQVIRDLAKAANEKGEGN